MSLKIHEIDPTSWHSIAPKVPLLYGIHSSPWGDCLAVQIDGALGSFIFCQKSHKGFAETYIKKRWPGASIEYSTSETANNAQTVIKSIADNLSPTISILLKGTPFQRSVWKLLLNIPFGQTTSYSTLATQIARPKALRAVGSAVGANPISLLLPCHRVLPKTGGIGNYAWGADRKQAILDFESKHS